MSYFVPFNTYPLPPFIQALKPYGILYKETNGGDKTTCTMLMVQLNHEFRSWRLGVGAFNDEVAKASMATEAPHQWWDTHGASTPLLRKLAMSYLAQTTTSSASERAWSALDAILTKRRNRLGAEK
jgi:hypothetical protein